MSILRPLFIAALAAPLCGLCDIPVFRYALERWPAAPYEFICFHRGPLGPGTEAVLGEIEKSSANAEVRRVDVDGILDKSLEEIWKAQGNPGLPWMAVRFPQSEPRMPSAWAGRPDASSVRSLLDSPARRDIARRLLLGESAVWLLLEGGETSKDEATARLLETELARLEKTLKLPETDEEGPPLLSDVPLKISFPVMRLSRRDPLEKSFVGLLSRSGGDLAEGKGPVVLPVFGRGRALWPLSGERLSAAEIAEAAEFLTGACSCQVKEMNPGLDLLFDADWEKSLSAPPSAGAASPPPSVQAAAPAAAARLARSWGTLWAGVAFLSIAVLVVGTLLLRPRRPPGPC